ncbi:MAG: type II secretion system protein GspL [Methyloprofundus sp.]|nr:type II secretion system protein GspL [Methyloprofundus sp.]
MDALLFIAIPAVEELTENTQLNWFHQSEAKKSHGYDTANNLKERFPEVACIAVLTGTKVLETQSELRIKNRKQLEQALSYDLEDQLAVEVDTLHFAYKKNAQKNLDISIIDKAYLEQIIQFFADQKLSLHQVFSETSLLSQAPEDWLIIHNEQQCLLKARQYCYSIETENLLLSLETLPEELELPEAIPVFTSGSFNLDLSLTEFPCTLLDDYFSQLCQYYSSQPPLNLLQGQYQVKTPKTWRLIFATCITGFILFSGFFSYQLYQNHLLLQQESKLEHKITTLYKKSFPKARRIINPVSQMRSKLKKLENNQVKNGNFIPLLAQLARVVRQQSNFQLNQLDYQSQTLNINFSTPSLEKLEQFKNNLTQLGLQAKVSSVNKEENRVIAQITITGGR